MKYIWQNTKHDFFQNFHFKLYILLLNINFVLKMSSFDIIYDDVAQKIVELKESKNAKNGHISYPLNLLFFVLHHHNVHQKNSFLIQN